MQEISVRYAGATTIEAATSEARQQMDNKNGKRHTVHWKNGGFGTFPRLGTFVPGRGNN